VQDRPAPQAAQGRDIPREAVRGWLRPWPHTGRGWEVAVSGRSRTYASAEGSCGPGALLRRGAVDLGRLAGGRPQHGASTRVPWEPRRDPGRGPAGKPSRREGAVGCPWCRSTCRSLDCAATKAFSIGLPSRAAPRALEQAGARAAGRHRAACARRRQAPPSPRSRLRRQSAAEEDRARRAARPGAGGRAAAGPHRMRAGRGRAAKNLIPLIVLDPVSHDFRRPVLLHDLRHAVPGS
jgi:hypothetical protein